MTDKKPFSREELFAKLKEHRDIYVKGITTDYNPVDCVKSEDDLWQWIEQAKAQAQIEVLEEVMKPVNGNESDENIERDCMYCYTRCVTTHRTLKTKLG